MSLVFALNWQLHLKDHSGSDSVFWAGTLRRQSCELPTVSPREAHNLFVLSCGEDDWVGSASSSHWGIPRLVLLPVLIPAEMRCAIRGHRAVTITLIFTFPFIN